ncbi:MAG: L,D-transpeptidase family protein [Sphingomonadaceae bacterium]|jgi:murein L,D-transpeptidase YafK
MRLAAAILSALALASCAAPEVPVVERAPAARSMDKPFDVTKNVDFILVDKSDRTLTLFREGRAVRTYRDLAFGDAPQGHKQFQGDERTPEGRYRIAYGNPQSAFHLSLKIDYPNAADRAYAKRFGRSPGGDIFIHGQPNGSPEGQKIAYDWTDGCIALSNAEIEELWQTVPDGTPIEIRP